MVVVMKPSCKYYVVGGILRLPVVFNQELQEQVEDFEAPPMKLALSELLANQSQRRCLGKPWQSSALEAQLGKTEPRIFRSVIYFKQKRGSSATLYIDRVRLLLWRERRSYVLEDLSGT